MISRFLLLTVLIVTALSLSGCFNLAKYDQQVQTKNQELSDKVQQEYGDDINQAKDEAKRAALQFTDKALSLIVQALTDTAKKKIDDWIAAQGLNQYGDPKDTMYAGGSPLFDEVTGAVKDKYEYILENHPELVEELDLEN